MHGEVNTSKESNGSNCSGGNMSRTLGMDGMLELLGGGGVNMSRDEQDEQHRRIRSLKGVNTLNMFKGV